MLLLPAIGAVAGLTFLVLIHELGHFLAAKLVGIRVEAFSFGFGPHIGIKIGETDYRLSLVPIGGYVKLAGETRDEREEYNPWELQAKSAGQKIFVFAAGALMNILAGFLLFIVAFHVGVPFVSTQIGEVLPGSPAWEAGLAEGDKVVAINGKDGAIDFEDLRVATSLGDTSKGVELTVLRDGKRLNVVVYPKYDEQVGFQSIGVTPVATLVIDHLTEFNGRCPAKDAGLKPGDRIIAVDGKPLKRWEDFLDVVTESPGKMLSLEIDRGGKRMTIHLMPAPVGTPMIGVSCRSNRLKYVRKDSWLAKAGVQDGDRIVQVGDKRVSNWSELKAALESLPPGRVAIHVVREKPSEKGGESSPKEVVLDGDLVNPARATAGLWPMTCLTVDRVVPGFPVERAGIRPGDQIVAINGDELSGWNDLVDHIRICGGKPFTISWVRDGKAHEATIEPRKSGRVGIVPKVARVVRRYSVVQSVMVGSRKCIVWAKRFYLSLRALVMRKVSARQIGGPILIVRATYSSAGGGLGRYLYFVAIISVHLGLFNLIPLPILDGGYIVLVLIEKLRGKPVSERVQAAITYVGLACLVGLLVLTTYNDLGRMFGWFDKPPRIHKRTMPKVEVQQVKKNEQGQTAREN